MARRSDRQELWQQIICGPCRHAFALGIRSHAALAASSAAVLSVIRDVVELVRSGNSPRSGSVAPDSFLRDCSLGGRSDSRFGRVIRVSDNIGFDGVRLQRLHVPCGNLFGILDPLLGVDDDHALLQQEQAILGPFLDYFSGRIEGQVVRCGIAKSSRRIFWRCCERCRSCPFSTLRQKNCWGST